MLPARKRTIGRQIRLRDILEQTLNRKRIQPRRNQVFGQATCLPYGLADNQNRKVSHLLLYG